MVNAGFGIAYPLVAVHDLAMAAATYQALGFDPGPEQPLHSGTVGRKLVFIDQCIELVTLADAAADDPLGSLIRASLKHGEGIALLGLHSTDIAADTEAVEARGA